MKGAHNRKGAGMSMENHVGIGLSALAVRLLSFLGYRLLTNFGDKETLNIFCTEENNDP